MRFHNDNDRIEFEALVRDSYIDNDTGNVGHANALERFMAGYADAIQAQRDWAKQLHIAAVRIGARLILQETWKGLSGRVTFKNPDDGKNVSRSAKYGIKRRDENGNPVWTQEEILGMTRDDVREVKATVRANIRDNRVTWHNFDRIENRLDWEGCQTVADALRGQALDEFLQAV